MPTIGRQPDGFIYKKEGTKLIEFRDFYIQAESFEDAHEELLIYIRNLMYAWRFFKTSGIYPKTDAQRVVYYKKRMRMVAENIAHKMLDEGLI